MGIRARGFHSESAALKHTCARAVCSGECIVLETNGVADLIEDLFAMRRLWSDIWHIDLARSEGI